MRATVRARVQQYLLIRLEVVEYIKSGLEVLDALAGGLDQEMFCGCCDDKDTGGWKEPLVAVGVLCDMSWRGIHP